jgi:ATP-dependent RNA helicase DeaD
VEEARTNVVLGKVRATLKAGDFKRQDQLIGRLLEEGFSSTDIASALLHHLQGGDGSPPPKAANERSERVREPQAGTPSFQRDPRPAPTTREGNFRRFEERSSPERNRVVRESERPIERRPAAASVTTAKLEKTDLARPLPARPAPPPAETAIAPQPTAARLPKPSRRTADDQTRLFVNLGTEMGISADDIVTTILGATGLPRKVVGAVDVRERHLFVDVASEHTNSIIAKLNRAQIKGRKAKVKVA